MVKPPLTARQAEILRYIEDYIADHGFPPSGRELGKACRLGSPSGAHRMLVRLEEKGYLTRTQGLSRGLRVAEQPISPSELQDPDYVALLAVLGWLSVARDAELTMAARIDDQEDKSSLIDAARERHQQVCLLESAVRGLEGGAASIDRHDPALTEQYDLLGPLPRTESWRAFVVDELVCNRVSAHISEYASRTRPAIRGLLWQNTRLSEQALTRSLRWAQKLIDSEPDDQEIIALSSDARELAHGLYMSARNLDAWCDGGVSLLSAEFDPTEAAALP